LGGVKHRIKDFLQDKWNRLKEKLGIKKPGKEEPKGGAKETPDTAAKKAAELPRAIAMARGNSAANDAVDTPVPALIGLLNTTVKRKYSWIKEFKARPKGVPGHYSIHMIASDHEIDPDYTTKSATPSQRTQAELDDLARDPAHGNQIEPKGIHERQVGLTLEGRGDLKPPIKRDPSGAAEFIDGDGVKWDIKGFNSNFPPKKGGFSLNRDLGKIEAELNKGENVILDTTQLSSVHIQQLRDAIEAKGWSGKIRWYP
jgi:hypothetical protein